MSVMRRNQAATYWYPTGNGSWGEPSWSDPQIIRVRWQDKTQLIRDKEGKEIVADAVVYTGKAIDLEGRLQKGEHAGNPGADAREPKTLQQHVRVDGKTDHWAVYL